MLPGSSEKLNKALSFVEGDGFGGLPSFRVKVNGATPPVAVASVRWQFRTEIDSPVVAAELTSAASKITISDASAWTFVAADQVIALTWGDYIWAMLFTDTNGLPHTYIEGTAKVGKKRVIPNP